MSNDTAKSQSCHYSNYSQTKKEWYLALEGVQAGAGNFRGVLIFTIVVVTKISNHEN
jgi:hypothetical protein